MFDDPKQRLRQMEQALKEAEMEALQEEDWLQDAKDFLAELEEGPQAPVRNRANNYGRKAQAPEPPRLDYSDREMGESDALYVEKPKRKGAGGLVILALLELIAIMLVILWWIKWMG